MTADQDVSAMIQGVTQDGNGNPTQTPLPWRPVYVRARTVISNILKKTPFSWPYNGSASATVSAMDYLEGTAEQVTYRYIDADGIVWDAKAKDLMWIEWFKAGCPTPTPALIAKWWNSANTLRSWPTTDVITGQPFTGMFAGEPTQVYPSYPPATS